VYWNVGVAEAGGLDFFQSFQSVLFLFPIMGGYVDNHLFLSLSRVACISDPIIRIQGCHMALEKELATYEAHVDGWTDHMGKFVLIQGDQIVDFFAAYEDALKAGYQQFGLDGFLVKQIGAVGATQFFTRPVLPHSTVHA
jgi:hypothetical protein